MQEKEIAIFYPETCSAWRAWLTENHTLKQSVWLVFYSKASAKPSISWSDAVDVALCFGWIDSKKIAIDKERSHQFFSKRKPGSTWSKINKEKVVRLTNEGLMTKAGFESIDIARQNGSWTILDDVEALKIPADLEEALQTQQGSKDYFIRAGKSVQKAMLQWIVLAKRPATRQQRIAEIVTLAALQRKPKQFM